MNKTERLKQGKIETKGDLATLGVAFTASGFACSGCLAVTVIGLPFLIVTLPISIAGLLMVLAAPFLKTKDVKCPKCGEVNHILTNKRSFACKECDAIVTFTPEGEPKL